MTNVLIFTLVSILISVANNEEKCQIGDPSKMALKDKIILKGPSHPGHPVVPFLCYLTLIL